MPVYPVTISIALRTGQLDGENQIRAVRIPLADLLISVTALELGYSVHTANLRPFNQVPGLSIVSAVSSPTSLLTLREHVRVGGGT
jgi:predicted nucleic acid-binding protein